MQKNIYYKFNKKAICILLLLIIVYSTFAFIPSITIKTYAANKTYTYSNSKNDLPSNFESTYPGYLSLLKKLAKEHPTWTFKLYETGLQWDEVINSEYQGHGGSPKNLVPKSYSSSWICSICGNKAYDNGSWRCASRGAIEHIMDPRNSLNDANIFEYLLLSYDKSITQAQVSTMASKISYLNTDAIKKAIFTVGKESNINPFYIIGKILQEQGSNGSVLCAGKGYKGEYVGVYNLFNVGASGNTSDEVIKNGLSYAQKKGWTTPEKSLSGGLETIKGYIDRGQNTLYYQKFNVVYKPYYQLQYAQNLFDAQTIGQTLKKYYNDSKLLDSSFTFQIPLYKGMPKTAVSSPSVTSVKGELAYVNASGGLALRSSPGGATIAYVDEGTQVVITKRASAKSDDGYYWDQVSTPQGTGYMARQAKDGSKTYLVLIRQYEVDGNNILVSPDATIKTIEGAKNTSKTFGTGAKITYEGKTYELVMLGDINGDGKINSGDLLRLQKHLLKVITLKDSYLKSSDVNGDNKENSGDLLKIQKHLLKVSSITL